MQSEECNQSRILQARLFMAEFGRARLAFSLNVTALCLDCSAVSVVRACINGNLKVREKLEKSVVHC